MRKQQKKKRSRIPAENEEEKFGLIKWLILVALVGIAFGLAIISWIINEKVAIRKNRLAFAVTSYYIYTLLFFFLLPYTDNSAVIFSVVSGMSLRNSRNRGRIQVSGNRCAHSRNNPSFRHLKKITEPLTDRIYFFLFTCHILIFFIISSVTDVFYRNRILHNTVDLTYVAHTSGHFDSAQCDMREDRSTIWSHARRAHIHVTLSGVEVPLKSGLPLKSTVLRILHTLILVALFSSIYGCFRFFGLDIFHYVLSWGKFILEKFF